MVEELAGMINELETDEQVTFIEDLYNNLDQFLPFLEQQSEKQEKWLNVLYEFYCNDNENAFEDYEE